MSTNLSNYYCNNKDIFIDSIAYNQPFEILKIELDKFNVFNSRYLAFKYGFNGPIAILHSIYVKREFRDGIGSRYLMNMISAYDAQKIKDIYLIADLTIQQEDGIDLILFYQKHGFEILSMQDDEYALMRLKINR